MPAAVSLPWGAWHGDARHRLRLPEHWSVDVLTPAPRPALTPAEMAAALDRPIGCASLSELASGYRSACIAVDDLARPTPAHRVLPHLISQLQAGGIPEAAISIVIATGTHGSLSPAEIRHKVGADVASGFHVECHCAESELQGTGIQFGKDELRVNRRFLEADLKLGVGSAMPHSFAAFSGGAKLLLPGLGDVASAVRSHKFVLMGLRGGADPDSNRFRLEAEEIARKIGFEYVVSAVTGLDRGIIGLFAGDLVAAHREACRFSANACATRTSQSYECLVLNAYPKDCDLIQSMNSLNCLSTLRQPILKEAGLVLLTTAAPAGIGRHGLFAPGGAGYRQPQPIRKLSGHDLWIYSPGASEALVRQVFWSGYRVFGDRGQLTAALGERFPASASAGVVPAAPLQQLFNQSEET